VDESIAWFEQSAADSLAAGRMLDSKNVGMRCNAIAKWQQTVEKAVKAIVAALREVGVLTIEIGYRHEVERFIGVLLRLPRAQGNKDIQQHLRGLLDPTTRADIRSLDALAPRRPPPGQPPRRNTEYPFCDAKNKWTFPAAKGAFSADEIQRFRTLAYRVLTGAGRIISAIRRRPQ
jgi:hypothetical protein